ncbi:hypothetical protein CRYPD_1334 [uncultured Candidatus Thioglobus sp.]|nr:hypothetical protein CRYPD_1334 [uncultured Candidatus Thioglobus sp.]
MHMKFIKISLLGLLPFACALVNPAFAKTDAFEQDSKSW